MKMLRCACGKTFGVKPESAGKVVVTPCCKTRVRVPADASAQGQGASAQRRDAADRIRVQCSCGQSLELARPKGPVEVQCPVCQKRVRVGDSAAAPLPRSSPAPPSSPRVETDLFDSLPAAGFPASAPPVSMPTGSMPNRPTGAKSFGPRKKSSSAPKRIPRLGILEDGFGTPLLAVIGIVFLGIFAGLGTYLFRQASQNIAKVKAAESWSSTDGEILDSGFRVRGVQRSKQTATITVSYQYQVDGVSYTGNTFSFEKQDSHRPNIAEAKLEPYPPGADCTVYYNPQSPSESVLIKDAQSSNTLFYWMGLAFILCGVVLAIDCWLGAINAQRFPPPKVPLI